MQQVNINQNKLKDIENENKCPCHISLTIQLSYHFNSQYSISKSNSSKSSRIKHNTCIILKCDQGWLHVPLEKNQILHSLYTNNYENKKI
jgi:hypothetical protein